MSGAHVGHDCPILTYKWGVVVDIYQPGASDWRVVRWFKTRSAAVAYGRRAHPMTFGICRIERLGGIAV